MKPTIWSRDFTLLWVTNFLMATSFYFLLPTVPAYSTSVLGAGKSQVGYLISIYTVAALLIRPLAGYMLDVQGRRMTYLVGLVFFALFIFTYGWAGGFLALLAIRFLHGLAWGTLTTGGSTVAADMLPAQRRGEGLGYYGMTMTLAMAFGPLLGLQVSGGGNYNRLFLVAGAVAAAAALLSLVIRFPAVSGAKPKLTLDSFVEVKVIPVAIISLFTMMSYGGIVSFITLFAEERSLNAGLFFLVYAVAMTLTRPFAGRLQDSKGPALVMGSGLAFLIAGFFALSQAAGVPGLAVASILLGIGNGNVFPTVQAMGINLVAPHRRGVASSTLFSFTDIGIGLGSMVLGWVADATSLSAMYVVCGVLLVIPLVWFFLYVGRYYASEAVKVKHGQSA